MISRLVTACILAALALVPGPAGAQSITTAHVTVEYQGVSERQARDFAAEAERAYGEVTRYFGRTLDRAVLIRVNDRFDVPTAYHWRATITVGANRIRGDAGGTGRYGGIGPAIVHEITHLVAPSRGKSDQLLDEGLGVFVQEKFKRPDDRSFPNMGRDVHEETVRVAERYGGLIPLADAWSEMRRAARAFTRDLVYLQAGSFVRYLVETYGLAKFMQMFEGGTYEGAYAKDLPALEMEWRAFLEGVRMG